MTLSPIVTTIIGKGLNITRILCTKYKLRLDPYTPPVNSALKNLRHSYNTPITSSSKAFTAINTSDEIISYNMQGKNNLTKVQKFAKIHKPAVICLQETKCTSLDDNLCIPGYLSYHQVHDVTTFVRDDIKVLASNTIPGIDIPHIRVRAKCTKTLDIINLYAREKTLTPQTLLALENKNKKAVIVGAFNAKHHDLLPHSQNAAYNANGKVLYQHRIGTRDTGVSLLHLHNPRTTTKRKMVSNRSDLLHSSS